MLEVVSQIRQPELDDAHWRFNTIGVLAPQFFALAIASVLLTVFVMSSSRRLWHRLWIGANIFAALTLLPLLPVFLLDVVHVRQGLPPSMQGRLLLLAVTKVLVAYGGTAVIWLLCAFSCRRVRHVAQRRLDLTSAWLG